MIDVPFEIGQEWWLPVAHPRQIEVPCPVCFGNLAVEVILGNGERVGVPCDGCGHGFDGPRGVIEEWSHEPSAQKFVIAEVSSMHGGRWALNSVTGAYAQFEDLKRTEAEAMAQAVQNAAAQEESNMRSRQRTRKNVQKSTWSVRYHREQIKDLERQLLWHRGKIEAKPKETL